jgi:hypothetical protein
MDSDAKYVKRYGRQGKVLGNIADKPITEQNICIADNRVRQNSVQLPNQNNHYGSQSTGSNDFS